MRNFLSLFVILLAGIVAFAQENLTYQKPPKSILDLADYQRAPGVSIAQKHV